MTRCAALVRDILVLLVIDVSSQHNRPGPRSPVAGWTGTHAGIFCSPIFCSLWCRGFRKGTKTMDKYRYSGSVKPSRKSFSVRCMLPSIESIRQGIEGIPERPSRISDFDRGLTTPSISSAPSSSVLTSAGACQSFPTGVPVLPIPIYRYVIFLIAMCFLRVHPIFSKFSNSNCIEVH